MSIVIKDSQTVPDGGWQYPGLAGFTINVRNYSLLYPAVRQHYESNGVPVPSEQEVIEWMCANLFLPCYDKQTRLPLINRFTQGLPTVSKSCCSK